MDYEDYSLSKPYKESCLYMRPISVCKEEARAHKLNLLKRADDA